MRFCGYLPKRYFFRNGEMRMVFEPTMQKAITTKAIRSDATISKAKLGCNWKYLPTSRDLPY